MSELFDETEFKRWLSQAEKTLESSNHDFDNADFSWCCFKAQQAAEYAVKSLLRGVGMMATGHSILKLLENLEQSGSAISSKIKECARSLDAHYIPARYPNAYPEGAPFEFYDRKTAKRALDGARKIVDMVKKQFERSLGKERYA